MSEYKLTIYNSKNQFRLQQLFVLVCLISIALWPQVYSWQWMVQAGLALMVVIFFFRQKFTPSINNELLLLDSGEVHLYETCQQRGEPDTYVLSPKSVCSDWFCYLILLPDLLPGAKGRVKRLWVFRDSVDELSYRRLNRVIFRLRRGG